MDYLLLKRNIVLQLGVPIGENLPQGACIKNTINYSYQTG